MDLRYRCLILDHDDTVVNSTAVVHHPAYLDAVEKLRPGSHLEMSLSEYFQINCDPGFMTYMEKVMKLSEEEIARVYEMLQSWVRRIVPEVYPGMKRIILHQKEEGGFVCVSSHSVDFNIRRDYRAAGLPEPDLVFGWELPKEQRKPSVFAVDAIMERLHLERKDILMVDDLKPGWEMAEAAGIDFAWAGWAHQVPSIEEFMEKNASFCFRNPEKLEAFLFET